MRVRVKTVYADPIGSASPGEIIDRPQKQCDELIAGGYAELVTETSAIPPPPAAAAVDQHAAQSERDRLGDAHDEDEDDDEPSGKRGAKPGKKRR
jgi:hypothetical protein